MRSALLCIVLLTIFEPLIINAKSVVVVLPRHTRRSPHPWRPNMAARLKKSSYGSHDHHHHARDPHGQHAFRAIHRPTFRVPPYPHGGDDFDQGHEEVNHIDVPQGKDVSHVITFGKGYLPYDNVKHVLGSPPTRYREADYAATGQIAVPPPFFHHEPHLSEPGADFDDRKSEKRKLPLARPIGPELLARHHGGESKDGASGPVNPADYQTRGSKPEAAVLLPAGIPAATIGGSKTGIVVKDAIYLDAYQKKIAEIAKTWPGLFQNGGFASVQNGGYASAQDGGYASAQNGGHATAQNGGYASTQNGGYTGAQDGGYASTLGGAYVGAQNGGYASAATYNGAYSENSGNAYGTQNGAGLNIAQNGLDFSGGQNGLGPNGVHSNFGLNSVPSGLGLSSIQNGLHLNGAQNDLQLSSVHSGIGLNSLPNGAYSAGILPGTGFHGATGYISEFAQPKSGYAVKEDTMEPPHDFRTMPIQTTPFQGSAFSVGTVTPSYSTAVHG